MPAVADRMNGVGVGFAAYFTTPPPDVIRFTIGEPDFDTPPPIVTAATQALASGQTHYTRGQGSEALCSAIAQRLSRLHGIPVDPLDVVVTPGAKQALLYCWMALSNPGDEVILLTPAWPSHESQLELLELQPVHVQVWEENYHPDVAAIEAAITERTRFILLNSPNNPTGAVYGRAELEVIARLCVEHDLWLVSDEIYDTMVWTDEGHHSPAAWDWARERVMLVGGFSKTWAMTGWRLGWVTGPAQAMAAVKQLQANAVSHVPTFAMEAAQAALQVEGGPEVRAMLDAFVERRALVMERLDRIPQISCPEPEGAFYAFVDIRGSGMDSDTFAQRAMAEARVQLIPGHLIPGGEGFVRISYATDMATINEGFDRLERWLAEVVPLPV